MRMSMRHLMMVGGITIIITSMVTGNGDFLLTAYLLIVAALLAEMFSW